MYTWIPDNIPSKQKVATALKNLKALGNTEPTEAQVQGEYIRLAGAVKHLVSDATEVEAPVIAPGEEIAPVEEAPQAEVKKKVKAKK